MVYYGQPDSSRDVIEIIKTYANRKSQFQFEGKPLVSTFSGEVAGTYLVSLYMSLFNEYRSPELILSLHQDNNPDYNSAWQSLKNNLGFQVSTLPSLTLISDRAHLMHHNLTFKIQPKIYFL